MPQPLKRISLMIGEDQSEELARRGLNVSGLVRDLVGDYLSEHKITIAVSEETRHLYERIVSNTGTEDAEVEIYFREALEKLLQKKILDMQELHETVFAKKKTDE